VLPVAPTLPVSLMYQEAIVPLPLELVTVMTMLVPE
jgi:hypothetical protein